MKKKFKKHEKYPKKVSKVHEQEYYKHQKASKSKSVRFCVFKHSVFFIKPQSLQLLLEVRSSFISKLLNCHVKVTQWQSPKVKKNTALIRNFSLSMFLSFFLSWSRFSGHINPFLRDSSINVILFPIPPTFHGCHDHDNVDKQTNTQTNK